MRESLPRGYYRELPELASGPLAGYPRVYELAMTLISHTEARIDLENVELVVCAFQEVAPLSIGELWAVPAMLRLGLIESVRRMALRTCSAWTRWRSPTSGRHASLAANASRRVAAALDAFSLGPPPLTPTFVSRFLHQLRFADQAIPSLAWLEPWLNEEALNAEEASARATQRVALTQIMMANSITSLRAIAAWTGRRFVERQSVLEAALRDDPAGVYPRMTFETRDHYRHVVERIAKRTGARSGRGGARASSSRAAAAVRSRPTPARARRLLPRR